MCDQEHHGTRICLLTEDCSLTVQSVSRQWRHRQWWQLQGRGVVLVVGQWQRCRRQQGTALYHASLVRFQSFCCVALSLLWAVQGCTWDLCEFIQKLREASFSSFLFCCLASKAPFSISSGRKERISVGIKTVCIATLLCSWKTWASP